MRTRTEEEKRVMGLLDPIFRDLTIKKSTRGYMPLMDLICYAYANPDAKFQNIMDILQKENFYVGVKEGTDEFTLIPSMERSLETALEGTPIEILTKYGLEKLAVLVEDRNAEEQSQMEEQLLADLGEKYSEYASHEERVIVFFARKLLKHIKG